MSLLLISWVECLFNFSTVTLTTAQTIWLNDVWHQGRNHVFKVGGPIPWSRVLLPFYRKKIRQVYPVWCSWLHNHTLFIKKLCKKLEGPSKFWGGPDPPCLTPAGQLLPAVDMSEKRSCYKCWSWSCSLNITFWLIYIIQVGICCLLNW